MILDPNGVLILREGVGLFGGGILMGGAIGAALARIITPRFALASVAIGALVATWGLLIPAALHVAAH